MHKGTTLFDNLQCLKWAREFGLNVSWNFLYGFPGEPPAAYARMAELVPLLTHLPPPTFMVAILVGRFSPLFNQAAKFGLKNLQPSPAYAFIFPFEPDVLTNLATTFIYQLETPQLEETYTQGLRSAIDAWQQAYPLSTLQLVDEGGRLCVHDGRPVAVQETTIFTGLQRDLYLACDEAQSISQLQRRVTAQTGQAAAPDEIEQLLQTMLTNKLMLQEGQRFLSLAIPAADFRAQ
jgi:magnesium-protoporphyrin IX monomethyl ester (oxidative) cyclase